MTTALLLLLVAQDKPPAPKGNYFKSMPKSFVRIVAFDETTRRVRFVSEAGGREAELPLLPEAEVQRLGYWAEPADFTPGDRVWIAVEIDDKETWRAVRIMLDGVSVQSMFNDTYTVGRTSTGDLDLVRNTPSSKAVAVRLPPGVPEEARLFWNSRYEDKTLVATDLVGPEAFERARALQARRHFERLAQTGLAAVVNDVDPVDGRLIVTVRRADALWARTLKMNDKVRLADWEARVHEVRPDYARAKLKLVAEGNRLTSLSPGTWVRLKMEAPKDLDPDRPPDPGRFTERADRIAWFLSSIYCVCAMAHDG